MDLRRQLLPGLIPWFPDRHFSFAGAGGYGTHEAARVAHRQRRPLPLVSRFYPAAKLYAPPPAVGRRRPVGRPRVKGAQPPAPPAGVAHAKRRRRTVSGSGGSPRTGDVVTGPGHWDTGGAGLVPIRWGFGHELAGTHRDEYCFTPERAMAPTPSVEASPGRWSIATPCQALRADLGLETTRGRTEATGLRRAPCVFGLCAVVALRDTRLPVRWTRLARVAWSGQRDVPFAEAMTAGRRWLWVEWVLVTGGQRDPLAKLSRPLRALWLHALAPAAEQGQKGQSRAEESLKK